MSPKVFFLDSRKSGSVRVLQRRQSRSRDGPPRLGGRRESRKVLKAFDEMGALQLRARRQKAFLEGVRNDQRQPVARNHSVFGWLVKLGNCLQQRLDCFQVRRSCEQLGSGPRLKHHLNVYTVDSRRSFKEGRRAEHTRRAWNSKAFFVPPHRVYQEQRQGQF